MTAAQPQARKLHRPPWVQRLSVSDTVHHPAERHHQGNDISHAPHDFHALRLAGNSELCRVSKAHRRFKWRVWLLLWRRRCRGRWGLLRLLPLLILLVLRSVRLVLLPVCHLLVRRQRSVLLGCHLLRHVKLHLRLLLWRRRQLLRLLPLLCGCELLLLLLHWWRSLLVRRLLLVWRRWRRQPRLLCLLRLALEWWLLLWGRRRPLVGLLPCHANSVYKPARHDKRKQKPFQWVDCSSTCC